MATGADPLELQQAPQPQALESSSAQAAPVQDLPLAMQARLCLWEAIAAHCRSASLVLSLK